MQPRRKRFAVRLVITLLFVPAIVDRLTSDEWVRLFDVWGYPPWAAVVISMIDLVGLAVLWVPALAGVACVVLMVILAGATGTWLIYGPKPVAAYPGTILVLMAWLARLERAGTVRDGEISR